MVIRNVIPIYNTWEESNLRITKEKDHGEQTINQTWSEALIDYWNKKSSFIVIIFPMVGFKLQWTDDEITFPDLQQAQLKGSTM